MTRLAVYRPLTVLMAILAIVLFGAVAYTKLPISRLPPIVIGVVSVTVPYPGADAADVEQLVAIPIENAVSGEQGINILSSSSSQGSAQVQIQLVDGYDPNQAAINISRDVGAAQRHLPPDVGQANVSEFDPNSTPILNIALTGAPLDQLYDIATNQLQPDLESVVGVGAVNVSGGLAQEVQVKVDFAKLAAYGITVQQVTTAISSANLSAPVGAIPIGSQQLNLRAVGAYQTPDALNQLVISQTAAGPVLLQDVATVAVGDKTQFAMQRINGQDAVGLSIQATSNANALQVDDDVRAKLQSEASLLPQGTNVVVTNDSSVFTRAALGSIQHDLLLSVLLVGAVILLFLHEWKHTIVVLLAIPTSLISTFFVMFALGFTLNIMTLMALALMIGILVDDSIVVLENIHRHLQLGENPWQAALNGRAEIGMAAIAITMADVVVYTPIAFMSGTVGQLFRQYGLTIVGATLFSMLISFTLTPMLASRWLSHDTEAPGLIARLGRWWDQRFDKLGAFVASTIPFTVGNRYIVLLIGAIVVGAVAAMLPTRLIGTEYAPQEDDNNFTAGLSLPPGSSLEAANQDALQMEAIMQQVPEIQYVFTTVSIPGGAAGFGGRATARANFAVQLADKGQRQRSIFEVINQLRGQSKQIPSTTFSAGVSSPIAGGGSTGNINIQLNGPDLATLNGVADQMLVAAQTVPNLVDMQNTSIATQPELQISFNRARMAQLGITVQQAETAMSTALSGNIVSELRPDGQNQVDIDLMGTDTDRLSLQNVNSIPVGTLSGTAASSASASGSSSGSSGTSSAAAPTLVTLGQIATITPGTGPVAIQRTDREISMTLQGQANGRPLGDVANDLRAALKTVPLPPGYAYALRGQVDNLNIALTALGSALVLSVVMEFMLLVALYESWLFPLVRMLTVPLGLVGALLALFVTGNTVNIFSIMGMIMAEGLVAKSGILLVDYTNTLRERGMPRLEALQTAARVRLRPILMTSATMVFGMFPLALKLEAGAESRAPMAVVVIGGLTSSTLLTMIVVPALYVLMDDLQGLFSRGKRPAVLPAELAPHTVGVPAALPGVAVAHAEAPRVAETGNGHGASGSRTSVSDGVRGNGQSNGHGNDHGHVHGHELVEGVDTSPDAGADGEDGASADTGRGAQSGLSAWRRRLHGD